MTDGVRVAGMGAAGVIGMGAAGIAGMGAAGVAGMGAAGVVGMGIDLVDVDRFRAVLSRRHRMMDRLFTPAERAYAEKAADPAARFAARFAAKEAVLKALGLGLGSIRMIEIEIVRLDSGCPVLVLHDGAASTAAAHGVGGWLVSLSHTDRLAQAVVVALAGSEGDAGRMAE